MKKKRERGFFRNIKGDIELDQLVYWIIAIVVLIIIVFGFFILKGKGTNALDFLKNLFRFGR